MRCILIGRKPKNVYICDNDIYFFTFFNWYKYSTLSFHAPALSLTTPADRIRTEYNAHLLNINVTLPKSVDFLAWEPSFVLCLFLYLLYWFSGSGSLLSGVQIEICNSRTHAIFTRKFLSLVSILNSLTPIQIEMVVENQYTPFQWNSIV